jgi:hypothetical protein
VQRKIREMEALPAHLRAGRGGLTTSYGSSYIITFPDPLSPAPPSRAPKIYQPDHDYVATTPRLGEPLPDEADLSSTNTGYNLPNEATLAAPAARQDEPQSSRTRRAASGPSGRQPSALAKHSVAPQLPTPEEDEGDRVLEEVRRLVTVEKDEALLLQLCAHHLPGAGVGIGLREALIQAAATADLPRRLSLLAALQVYYSLLIL